MSQDYIHELGINPNKLDVMKEQTDCKIRYVTGYVREWLFSASNWNQIKHVNFIDCMCNAGLYQDNKLGTAPRVYQALERFAKDYPQKEYSLFVNDIDSERVRICKTVCRYVRETDVNNLHLYETCFDVDDYLRSFDNPYGHFGRYDSMSILFVDPYNARSVTFSLLQSFLRTHYSELLFNWFSSDLTRNRNDQAIINSFEGIDLADSDDALQNIVTSLKDGRIRYVFSYPFRNSANAELYQILFATGSDKGLKKLKSVLWEVFGGKEYHRNRRQEAGDQLSLFSEKEEKDLLASYYAHEAKRLVVESFQGRSVYYSEIESFVLERTMLNSGHIITYVLRPLVQSGVVKKVGSNRAWRTNQYVFQD